MLVRVAGEIGSHDSENFHFPNQRRVTAVATFGEPEGKLTARKVAFELRLSAEISLP
jgi:hypothetical protein